MNFRPQQQTALDYPGNVAISAGAGSGKTRVLVEKYFRLLADEHPDWPVQSVAAITFTVKAASELRVRIMSRIRQELADAAQTPERRARLIEMRRQIGAAPIGTIHNFCVRILRDFHYEARLDPDFLILEGVDELALRRQAAESAFEDVSALRGTQEYGELLLLTTVFSRSALLGHIEAMLARRAEYGKIARFYVERGIGQLDSDLCSLHGREVAVRQAGIVQQLREALAGLKQTLGLGGAQVPKPLESALAGWDATAECATWEWPEFCSRVRSVQDKLFTKQGELRKNIGRLPGLAAATGLIGCVRDLCGAALSPLCGELSAADRENLEISLMLSRLYLRAETIHRRLRSAGSNALATDLLDFTDLEIRAEELLRNNRSVIQRLRERIRFMIIDEFQDTSEIQWRIAASLVCGDDGKMLPSRFFMVGDAKQSVYGFRQANTRIFERVREMVIESNMISGTGILPVDRHGQDVHVTPDRGRDVHAVSYDGGDASTTSYGGRDAHDREKRGALVMNDNFRTLPLPLGFVNWVFETLMDENRSEHDVAFEPLVAQRVSEPGRVELLIATEAPSNAETGCPGSVIPPRCVEAEVVADKVREAADGHFGDVALLFRKRKHFAAYEAALRTRNIPFATYRGAGLYGQPEVEDLVALLRMLIHPGEDHIAAQFLRGSLSNFSDELLLKISFFPGRSLWEKCENAFRSGTCDCPNGRRITLSQGEVSQTGFVWNLVSRLECRAGILSVDAILREAVALTGAEIAYGAAERGEQARANVLKFIESAQRLGTHDIEDFLDFVDRQSEDPRGEGEASADLAGTGAVRLMTVHAAKGLEFPIVFLPELADKFWSRETELISDGQQWFATKRTRNIDPGPVFLHAYLSEMEQARSAAEEKRVFYVAATRCRDELYLSASAQRGWENSIMEWIGSSLRLPERLKHKQQEYPSPILSITEVQVKADPICAPELPEPSVSQFARRLKCNAAVMLKTAEALLVGTGDPQCRLSDSADADLPPFRPRPLKAGGAQELAVTELQDFIECPERFFLMHIASMPPTLEGAAEQKTPLDALVRGAILHDALQLVRKTDIGGIRQYINEEIAARCYLEGPQIAPVANELTEHIGTALESGVLGPVLRAPACEFGKLYWGIVGGLKLSAKFDCELAYSHTVEIADFYTGAAAEENSIQRTEMKLRIYLLLLSMARPDLEELTARLLFTRSGAERTIRLRRHELARISEFVARHAARLREFFSRFGGSGVLVNKRHLAALADFCRDSGNTCSKHARGTEVSQ